MARANTIQTNFTSGELSPNMYGRVDVTKYFNGARKLQDVICLPQGGFRRTPGTKYLGTVKDVTKKTLVRKFTVARDHTYILEFGHQILRIWQNGAIVGAPVEVVTPYGQNDLAQLRFAQSADTLFIAHPSYYPRVLTRSSHTSWAITTYDNVDGPYMSVTPDVTLTLSNVVDRATATAISSIFSTSGSVKNITAVAAVSATNRKIQITATAHGFTTGDAVLIKSVSGVPESLGAWIIDVVDVNNFTLRTSFFRSSSSYTSGGTAQVCSGALVKYREDDIYKIARVIDITSGTVATVDVIENVLRPDSRVKLTFIGIVSDSLTAENSGVFAWSDVGKFIRATEYTVISPTWLQITTYKDSAQVTAVVEKTLNFANPTKDVTVTGRTITGTVTASAATFASTDVGRHIRLKYGSKWVVAEITAYTSTTVVTVSLEQEPPLNGVNAYETYDSGRTDNWKFGAWSATTGYPSSVNFHQNRLVWSSTTAEPSSHWMTKSGDYYDFEPSDPDTSTVSDDNSISVTLLSRQPSKTAWLDSGPVLLVGTEGAEWQIKPSSIQQTITPTNISATVQTAYGSADLDAYRVGSQTLFIDKTGLKLRELSYDFSIDAFACKDISILSEHILREHGGVVDWSIQRSPYAIIWLVLGDGNVATVTYEKEHEIVAWSLQSIGGTVESVCCASAPSGEDQVYFVVKRNIDGSDVRYIEMITGIMSDSSVYLNCWSSSTYASTPVATQNATHLENATVGVMLNTVYIGEKTANGAGVVDTTHGGYTFTVTSITIGLRKTAILGILDPEGGSQAGSSQGKKKRISETTVRVVNSWYFKSATGTQVTNDTENLTASVDPTSSNYTRITPAQPTIDPDLDQIPTNPTPFPVVPVSGDITFSTDDNYDSGGRLQIVQDEPYPLNVTCLMHKLNTNE